MAKKTKFESGKFTPSNPEKYTGPRVPRYRSSWELTFMRMCDRHPNIVSWASEPIRIPYMNPLTNKLSVYVPDFLMVYEDKKGNRKQELIEVKPAKETHLSEARSQGDRMRYAVNMAKWRAAAVFCKNHGLGFKVINENELFGKKPKPKGKRAKKKARKK